MVGGTLRVVGWVVVVDLLADTDVAWLALVGCGTFVVSCIVVVG